jgi:hypothetical protein
MRKSVAAVTGASLLLMSCASSYRPIVDMKGVDSARYEADLAECRAYAEEVSPAGQAVAGAGIAAALGAALGAVAGAFSGNAGSGAAYGASIGGVTGTAAGGAGGVSQQRQVIDRCLIGRGYSVLG